MKTIQRTVLFTLFLTFAVQFAGCGAADIQSAKMSRDRRDYSTANKMLEKALQEDPTSDEAWFLYTVNLYDLNQLEKIATIIDTAMLYSVTHRSELQTYKLNTWTKLYMGGYSAFNANPDSKETQKSAIDLLESARKLEPEQPLTYELLGVIYYASGDTVKGLENYNAEINQVSSSYDQGASMGLMLHLKPEDVERAIGGAPASTKVVLSGQDSAKIFIYPSKQAYIYFMKSTKPPYPWELTGWRIGATEAQGLQPVSVSTQPYELVANDYYQKGLAALAQGDKNAAATQFDKAIPLLMTLQQIDPSDEFAAQAIPEIYTRLDRTEKAKAEYERILAERPSRAMYISYGMLLMKAQDYQSSVHTFEKALALKPDDEAALYDIAAAYKNWAATDQKAGKKDAYKAELEQSTDYFEKLHAIDKSEVAVLEQLAENYEVLGKKDKYVSLVSEFEALKGTDAANTSDYWDWLGKIYARAGRSADSEAAYKKSDELKQAHK